MELSPTATGLLIAAPFIVWRLYSRIRRLIGRQQSRPWRHWAAAIFFPLITVLLGLGAFLRGPLALVGLAGGLAVGVGLAIYGLRLTAFERTEAGYFYTPNAHIGIALTVLLVGRLGYRFYQMATLTGTDAAAATQNFGSSPATLIIFGMLAGYYTSYAIGLLRWRSTAQIAVAATPASSGTSAN